MGIPGLLTLLQPYGKITSRRCSAQDCEEHANWSLQPIENVIVDGPCLAHFVFRRLRAHYKNRLPAGLCPTEYAPSYDEIGEGVVAYLDQLKGCGLMMCAAPV